MTMKTRRCFFNATFPAAAMATLLIAVPADAQQLKAWRHGIVQAKSDAGFVFMAVNGGFMEKQGLKVEMVQFTGDALALKALLAGELDSYEGSPGGPMLAASQGADIKLLGCYWPGLTYGIYGKSSIAGPKDLKGKSMAISAPGALPDLLARAVLEQNNIPSTEVRFAVMGSDTDRYRAVTVGTVDAAAASTEFVPLAAQAGVKLIVHAHDVVPNYLRFCSYVSGKTLAQRNADVVAFLAAQIAGLRYAMANRDKTVELATRITEAKPDDPRAAYIYDEVKTYSAIDPDMPIPMDKLAWMRELLTKTGNLTKPVDLGKLADGSARDKALVVVGK
ncbi:MAG: NitT/TauT family transport system substrate-binding protein [Alphaproteobacteria bacterium]|jgi:NitT/TauT family transport system substrate-binding protein|nr:NitT/TauT family transport system substrate-binding protein [Alphaproteobacteria bacterium]